jgi:hypothetical protein
MPKEMISIQIYPGAGDLFAGKRPRLQKSA